MDYKKWIDAQYDSWLNNPMSGRPFRHLIRTISGKFYHITSGPNAERILKNGFDLGHAGKGYGFINIGEPIGISFFLKKEDAFRYLNQSMERRPTTGKDGSVWKPDTLLEAQVASIKTINSSGISVWPEFMGQLLGVEGEEVFDHEFVTKALLKIGIGAVLHPMELRVLDISRITSVVRL